MMMVKLLSGQLPFSFKYFLTVSLTSSYNNSDNPIIVDELPVHVHNDVHKNSTRVDMSTQRTSIHHDRSKSYICQTGT